MRLAKDLLLRFVLGGLAVAVCYVLLLIVPWKSMAGIFAAFPAVMVAAVTMAGHFEGNEQAAHVAYGATAGMMGCSVCVCTSLLVMRYYHSWSMAIIASLIAWVVSSLLFITLMNHYRQKP